MRARTNAKKICFQTFFTSTNIHGMIRPSSNNTSKTELLLDLLLLLPYNHHYDNDSNKNSDSKDAQ
jgi:hypothetical protein